MGKRLSRTRLLDEIRHEKGILDGLLAALRPREMTSLPVTKAGWTVKDILGHLIGWQQMPLGWHATERAGGVAEVPMPGLRWSDVRQINEIIFRKFQRKSLNAVLNAFADSHQQMLDLIDSLSDIDLVTPRRFAWTGPTWTASDHIRAATASHYRWAGKHLKKWLDSGSAV
jgi:hypothetical protein